MFLYFPDVGLQNEGQIPAESYDDHRLIKWLSHCVLFTEFFRSVFKHAFSLPCEVSTATSLQHRARRVKP